MAFVNRVKHFFTAIQFDEGRKPIFHREGAEKRHHRNSERRRRGREVVVPMRIISLHIWIGEKIKTGRTCLMGPIWDFGEEYRGGRGFLQYPCGKCPLW
jgi:hypothetical protein